VNISGLSPLTPIVSAQGTHSDGGWFTGDRLVAVATIVAALMMAAVAIRAYRVQQRRARDERYARAFAEAIQAVEDYLETPYRIRRRPPRSPAIRFELTGLVSDIQSRIAFHEAWLTTMSPLIARAYRELIVAARQDAGPQMTAAGHSPPTRRDGAVPIGQRYEHPLANAAKERCLAAMQKELSSRAKIRRRRTPTP